MDRLSVTDPCEKVVVWKGTQLGATEMLNNWLFYVMLSAPGDTLFMSATKDLAKRNNRSRIRPMIASCPELAERVGAGWSTLHIQFRGGQILLVGANSAAGLRQDPMQYLSLDEIDAFERELGQEGDPIGLALARADAFEGRKKIALVSTCTVKGTSRIEAEYRASDQRRYMVPCPFCNEYDWIRWENIQCENKDPKTARLQCIHCERLIEERWKESMMALGTAKWVPTAPRPSDVPGYHLSALYSTWKTWETCARQFFEVEKDPPKLRVWVNTVAAETFEERGESADAETVYARRKPFPIDLSRRLGESEDSSDAILVPEGAGVLVCSTDTQDNRLETHVKAYGPGEQSWLISFRIFDGNPDVMEGESVWRQLDRFLRSAFTHVSGRKLWIESAVVDSGGHHTERVFQFTKRREHRLLRPGWSQRVSAVHGGRKIGAPIVGRPTIHEKYHAKSYEICSDAAKGTIVSRLRIQEPGPGYMHLPATGWCDFTYCEGLTAETARWKFKNGRYVRSWDVHGDNHPFDLEQYTLAALHILGPELIRSLNVRAARWAKPVRAPRPPVEPSPLEALAARRRKAGWMERWKR